MKREISWKTSMISGGMVAVFAMGMGAVGSGAVTQAKTTTPLHVEVFNRGNSPSGYTATNNYWTQWLQKNFAEPNGIDLQYVSVPRSQEYPALETYMAAGGTNIPDIMFGYETGIAYKFASEGGLTNLGPLVQKYGPALKAYLGKTTLNGGKFDGVQYTIPAKRVWLGKYSTYIRTDWLKKLHLQAPTNTTQLYNVLLAFKEHHMGGKNTIPLGMALDQASYQTVIWSFINTNISDEQRFVNTEPTDDALVLLPGFENALRWLNKAYHAGLISPDMATDPNGTILEQDVMDGEVGVFSMNELTPFQSNPGIYAVLQKNDPSAQLGAIMPWQHQPMYTPLGMYIMVPKSVPHASAVAAVKYLNFLAEPTTLNTIMFGYKGKTYSDQNGIPVVSNSTEAQRILYNSGDIELVTNGVDYGSLYRNEAAQVYGNPGFNAAEQKVEFKALQYETTNDISELDLPHPVAADSEYATELDTLYQQIIVKAMEAPPSQLNSVFNSLKQNYLASGGAQVRQQMQAEWNSMTPKVRASVIALMNKRSFN